MKTKRNGLSIGLDRVDDEFFLSLKGVGKLTHEDYQVITPMIDSALSGVQHAKINAIFDATEMEGWELRAAWDDFRLGLKHGKEFQKIAIFGNKGWQKTASKIGSWFVSGEMQYFESEEAALKWLSE